MPDSDLGSSVASVLDMLAALARTKPALRKLLTYGEKIGADRTIAAALELVRAWRAHDTRRGREEVTSRRGRTESIEFRVPDAAPRKLAAFANRCEALVAEAS